MTQLDEIRQRIDIVDVIGETVALHKAGRNYKALCPFHPEKTPSFFVFPDRQRWHCFGACATGGDVFTFVMRRHNLDFGGALRLLAERAGVTLKKASGRGEQAQKERLRRANEAAAVFFQNALFSSIAGAAALDYITMRGIDRETAEAFQLGYSPDSWDALREHLKARGFDETELLRAGLLVEGELGPHDRFRDRLMFPIRDEQGRVVGFGSRRLKESATEESPKYLNTPQTPIFDKGAILYGLDKAREAIRRADLAVIVEGYMDVIAAHQHDYRNVVASMGTALTERQVGLLRGLTSNLALAFDPDEAGQAASERGTLIAYEQGADIRIIRLPEGKDPDQIIRSSPESWRRFVAEAQPYHPPARERERARPQGAAPGSAADPGKSEELCLALLFRYPHLRARGLDLPEDTFVITENRLLFNAWQELPPDADLEERVPDELWPHLQRITNKNLPAFDDKGAENALNDCIGRIERRKLRMLKVISSLAIAEKEQELGAARLAESARRLLNPGAPPDSLPDDVAEHASLVLQDMETGRELHLKQHKNSTQ